MATARRASRPSVTADTLAAPRRNPHAPEHVKTVLSCLRTILEEEWEHLRYAVRDLDALAALGFGNEALDQLVVDHILGIA